MNHAPLLDTIADHWQAQGWPLDTLATFRMEGEGDAGGGSTATETATEAVTEPATPAADADPFDSGADQFDRAYVEKLRGENARYRTERNTVRDENGRYAKAFEGLDDDVRETFLSLPARLRDDPAGTATWLAEQAQAILDEHKAADPADDDAPLTREQARAEVERALAERDKAQSVRDSIAAVNKTVKDLGYDPKTFEGKAFMAYALEDHGGDLAAADKAVKALKSTERQKAVDDYLAGRLNDAENTPAPVPQGGAGAGAAPAPIVSFEDAEKAAQARIAAKRLQPGR